MMPHLRRKPAFWIGVSHWRAPSDAVQLLLELVVINATLDSDENRESLHALEALSIVAVAGDPYP